MTRYLSFFLFAAIFLPFTVDAEPHNHSQRVAFEQALRQMTDAPTDPFLIVEIQGTQKYIQFYHYNPGILLDLPVNPLSESELDKAQKYFNSLGIEAKLIIANDAETGNEFEIKGWSEVFDEREFDRVVNLAFGVLFEVYGVSEQTELQFIKGWEQ